MELQAANTCPTQFTLRMAVIYWVGIMLITKT